MSREFDVQITLLDPLNSVCSRREEAGSMANYQGSWDACKDCRGWICLW
jgi:hypothetical protein